MIIQRTVDVYCGFYDFGVSGGAIGTIDLQVPIPQNTILTEFGVVVKTAPLSGGLATISFDTLLTSVSPNVLVVGALIPATAIAVFSLGAVVIGIVDPTAPLNNGPFNLSIAMSIAAFALTTGQLQFYAKGISFDF